MSGGGLNLLRRVSGAARRAWPGSAGPASAGLASDLFQGDLGADRRIMIERHLWRRGIRDRRVLAAMAKTPRELFIAARLRKFAYADRPLEIGRGQTISQPYVVAKTLELAQIGPGTRVLEIGVGCGYQTAALIELGAQVFGIEIVEDLAEAAWERLERLGYRGLQIRNGDGFGGWPEAAPFDAVILAAAPFEFPQPLLDQLADGGRLVGPAGPRDKQVLMRIARAGNEFKRETVFPVRFVPMTGRAERSGRSGAELS